MSDMALASGRRLFPPFVRLSWFGDLEEKSNHGAGPWVRVTGRREHIFRWRAAQHVRDGR